jgi:hypothetical protein
LRLFWDRVKMGRDVVAVYDCEEFSNADCARENYVAGSTDGAPRTLAHVLSHILVERGPGDLLATEHNVH